MKYCIFKGALSTLHLRYPRVMVSMTPSKICLDEPKHCQDRASLPVGTFVDKLIHLKTFHMTKFGTVDNL